MNKSEPISDLEPLNLMVKCQRESNLSGLVHVPTSTVLDAFGMVVEIEDGGPPKEDQGPITQIRRKAIRQ